MKIAPASQPKPSSWFTLSKKSGSGNDTIAITALPNTSTSPRSAVVTVRTGSVSKTLTLTQEGATATKGKITFEYTGAEIPQKYVDYLLYFVRSESALEDFMEFGRIESINANAVVVNIDYMDDSDLNIILEMLSVNSEVLYFGVSSSDDPTISWDHLLLANDSDDKDYVSELVAAKIQNAFNGLNDTISCESLVTPSVTDIVCSWGIPETKLIDAGTTQATLDEATASRVDFKVFADIYPDGQRLNDDSMINIEIGRFTLGEASDGKWLSRIIRVKKASAIQQFTWRKEWSTVALCRFTISCTTFNEVDISLNDNLVINGKTFIQRKNGGDIYFENTEGIPLQRTSDSQDVNISSNTPYMEFTFFA